MPRNARKEIYSEIFHIMIQGINKEYIFKNDTEINTYLKYLKERLNDRNLKIIAYCIMNNHAHFLIHTNDIMEISKLMSQVNTKYAIFYNKINNRCGFVFRNRYKSEQILTYSHLISCIEYIHNNPVKAGICDKKEDYQYSSYNNYKNNDKILNTYTLFDILKNYNINLEDVFKERYKLYKFIDDIENQDKDQLKKTILEEFLKKNNIKNVDEVKNNYSYLKQFSTIMCIEYNFTQKEIAEFLGLNRLKIHRILHEL